MRLVLNTSGYVFEAAKSAEPKMDRDHGGVQRLEKDTGRPLWIVQVIAKGQRGPRFSTSRWLATSRS